MEERIIDDEYGRGIRLRKTQDGYVDVTDELTETGDESEDFKYDEIAFEFPELEEDDEDLVSLSPEEALALRKRKAEEAENKRRQYAHICEEGEKLLDSGSFHAAELKFETALKLDPYTKDAIVGYWRAKTANFTNPDALMDEYAEIGIENLEGDLGYEAVDALKRRYPEVFAARLEELEKQKEPIQAEVLEKRENRRKVISEKKKKAILRFAVSTAIALVLLIATIVLGTKIFSTREGEFILPTIVSGAVFVVALIVALVFTNKLLNVVRMYRLNERDDSTELGRKLVNLCNYIELYEEFTKITVAEETEETEETDETHLAE
ncbi:MAG: hypothetical protein IKA72_03185 [Clostridia bacterium]|nr:hypothetical protein [Clostridia bacterium]